MEKSLCVTSYILFETSHAKSKCTNPTLFIFIFKIFINSHRVGAYEGGKVWLKITYYNAK